ncbi:MAG: hydantoinase/oxoprolinase family protein [Proteobacteria bacterium]|nr:hydantoinase/oxoprolinase family protein [Pseudomonadota bacterium]
MSETRAYRIGIDVGGTFTKAVLIDTRTREVVGRASVHTTHDHKRGVAAGVVEVFERVLKGSNVRPGEVVFLAHSTTQATNALLEGDVAKVGVVAMAGRNAAALAEPQARIEAIELASGRWLDTANRFLVSDDLAAAQVAQAIDGLVGEGCRVLVASAAFGVDNTGTEELVRKLGGERGLPTTCGHEITRLYGLTTRTRTAVINASILPRMIATADMTEASVREAGIEAPLMVMRGDGGVMDIREMRRRPAMTMLSGPAASVAGALMHLKVADGIYFEVGGTSTNIGVIKNGRPTVAYARVGGHETYVASLDVRVIGIAGGSLIRAEKGRLIDVGPRSAHIAGLAYAAFAKTEDIADPVLELFEPKRGDGGNWVAIRVADGRRFALTNTCAANALGLTQPGVHAHGNREAARLAFAPLAELLGTTIDEAATAVLDCAAEKVLPVVADLIKEYELDPDQQLLIGEGGGAASLIPHVAARTGLKHEISRDAEVISSIGVALALVREVIERIVPHPTPEDLLAIRHEALEAVVRLGADPAGVDVTVEVDTQTHRVRATAMGAAEMRVKDASGGVSESEARATAARSLDVAGEAVLLVAETSGMRAFQPAGDGLRAVRVVDWTGAMRVQRSRAIVRATTAGSVREALAGLWREAGGSDGPAHAHPGLVLLHDRHLVDLSGLEDLAQTQALAADELAGLDVATGVVLIAMPAGHAA